MPKVVVVALVGFFPIVVNTVEALNNTGIGGVIIHFRLGAMPYELAANSLKLFAEKVAPNFD